MSLVEENDSDIVPDELKHLRACMVCSLVKTLAQFVGKCAACAFAVPDLCVCDLENGCENCRQLNLENDAEYEKKKKVFFSSDLNSQHTTRTPHRKVKEVTSTSFEGLIGVNDMKDSWVRNWQQLPINYVRGCYAVSVNGVVPHHIVQELQDKRIPLASRNRQFDPAQDLARLTAAGSAKAADAEDEDDPNE